MLWGFEDFGFHGVHTFAPHQKGLVDFRNIGHSLELIYHEII